MGEIRAGGHRIGEHGWEPVGNAAPVVEVAAEKPVEVAKKPIARKQTAKKAAAAKAPKPRKR